MGARHAQHFLRNRGAIETILSGFDPQEDDLVVEIGPGRGALTLPLAERLRSFIAVEIDPALARRLSETLHIPLMQAGEERPRAASGKTGGADGGSCEHATEGLPGGGARSVS